MTCATCHGRGVYDAIVTTFSFNQGDHPRDMNAVTDKQLRPCPDCTPKPFAEVTVDRSNYAVLRIAGEWVEEAGNAVGGDELRRIADAINASTDAREAKLQAAIRTLRLAIGDALGVMAAVGPVERESACWFHMRRALDETDREPLADGEGVTGHVACALAFDLGVMQGHFHGSWQVMLDVLLEKGGEASELAWELAGLLGADRTRSAGAPAMFMGRIGGWAHTCGTRGQVMLPSDQNGCYDCGTLGPLRFSAPSEPDRESDQPPERAPRRPSRRRRRP